MSNLTKAPLYVLHAPGTNRDQEAAWAASEAGFNPRIVHIAELVDGSVALDDAAATIVPGGFSYGDALGAGVRLALDLRLDLASELRQFVAGGGYVLGICNGFQALVKAGLLPGPATPEVIAEGADTEAAAKPTAPTGTGRQVTLTHNQRGRFECRWVHLEPNRMANASWLSSITELIHCPIAHGEGRFQVADSATLTAIDTQGLAAFRYVDANGEPAKGRYPINPNGSAGDLAGICDVTGRVVGLMPHPEDHIRPVQRPHGPNGQLGLALFTALRNAVG